MVRPAGGPEWRFAVLGRVRAWRFGREIDLGAPQQRTTLAMLLLREGAPATLDELINGLWGEDVPSAAVGTVRTYISRLRRALCPDGHNGLIVSGRGGYRLPRDRVGLDFADFRALVAEATTASAERRFADAARRLGDGLALFDGITLAGAPGPYASAQRDRIEHLRGAADEDRLAAEIELGRYAVTLADLCLRIAAEPLRERLRELQMLALWRDGRQAEALVAFHQARTVLATELGVDPGPGLRRLHAEILAGDTPVQAEARPVIRVPAQAPAPPSDFTGRAALVSRIVASLDRPGAVPVVGVAGLPGSGKTAVIGTVAQRVAHLFPDGVLHTDLGGGTATPGDVLAGWLRALGVAASAVPAALPERAALWRTTLAGRRILVTVDGAADGDADLHPLLPAAPGCAVLFTTSRLCAVAAGAEWHRVGPFTRAEALEYLGRRIGPDRVAAEPAAAAALVTARACQPLALRAVATRLAARPAWTLAEAGSRLSADDDAAELYRRLDPVRGTLDCASADVLATLAGAAGGMVTAGQVGYLLGLMEREAEAALDTLAERFLVEALQPGRYRIDHLVRRYAALRRSPDVAHRLVAMDDVSGAVA
ncbi:hypothetical protein JCM9534A_16830 [Catenuloplanes indicus JCM 9534]